MCLTRTVEEKIVSEYPKNEIRCPVHLSIGQEAISAGVSAVLGKKDCILSAHRSHAHYLSKGGSIRAMIGEIYGKETGCVKGLGGSMHLLDIKAGILGCVPIVGSTISIAAGIALANKLKKKNSLTVVYFGDGAVETGVFYETLNFSKIHNLPILFICENNFYSTFANLDIRNSKPNNITHLSKSVGIKSFKENGNDVEKVFKKTLKAKNFMNRNNQPVLIEFMTHRVYEHCGPNIDDILGYRPQIFLNKWLLKCPLKQYEKKLIKSGALSKKNIEIINDKIKTKVDKIFQKVKKDKFPKKSYLNKFIYAK
tara:strand:- start:43339 stop:44271 length:933 start_codon:yes stop_codon:yes gene_type:complete